MTANVNELHSSIVDPARLSTRLRNDVCYECHMQPSVVLPATRRYGRDLYSFRPGTALDDYLLQFDVTDASLPRADRFEINHHPYRLEQSRCFRESGGRLSCLSCHDPHRKVPEEQRAAHYRTVCLGCHPNGERVATMGEREGKPAGRHQPPLDADADCTACHMPKRRTQDVVHVVMTDHFIRRKPGGSELVAPLEEREPRLDDVELLDPQSSVPAITRDLVRSAVIVRATGGASASAVRRLQQSIAETHPSEAEPYLDLAMGLLRQQKYEELETTVVSILAIDPKNAQALEWRGLALFHLGKHAEGISAIEQGLAIDPTHPEAHFNLGLLLAADGKTAEAIPHFERATQLRPNLVLAWFHLGEAYTAEQQLDKAIDAYTHALAIDPTHTRSYAAIGKALLAAGRREAAIRYWTHGARFAAQPDAIEKLLSGMR
jgi:predicted CXXCH cytochrome family protein